jgi:starch phosphorylase
MSRTNQVECSSESTRVGLSEETLKRAFLENLFYSVGRVRRIATRNDLFVALARTIRDRMLHRWVHASRQYVGEKDVKVVSYLSAEFLTGPHLANNLINLGIYEAAHRALEELGIRLEELIEHEQEPGLGNGGLGRLAACFLDSLSTLEVPAVGYGIRYEYGMFDQVIRDGWQVEIADNWLNLGNPWEIVHPEIRYDVKFGGHTESGYDDDGRYWVRWIPQRIVRAIAHDTPILGYRVNTCNTLRLWRATAYDTFDFQEFNIGDYSGAVEDMVTSETISKVLYPNDDPPQGKMLRLQQQYLLVTCSLQDMIRLHLLLHESLHNFCDSFTIQLNDTHPALSVAELIRLLVDEHAMDWETAWDVTRNALAYTNHTLLPEALEKWSLPLFQSLLPRHLEIIYEINRRFLDEVSQKFPGDTGKLTRLSLIDEAGERYVRMANLACVGSHSVNGVAELHTRLLEQSVLKDFCDLYPERFNNKTNGVTPRRFTVLCNPRLAKLLCEAIGEGWIKNLDELRGIEKYSEDHGFREDWCRVKSKNKVALANYIKQCTDVAVDPESLFDVQAKRIHEYKRQHLNVLHIITLYQALKQDRGINLPRRTFIFSGKAAPGYYLAKLIIKLVNSVADLVNSDSDVNELLKVVFVPDFNVKLSQRMYPAADLSEQISTAGKEASGTGNMKFALNGALTIGTLDGANVEIRQEVGAENFFLFGLTADEVSELKAGGYRPRDYYDSNYRLREALDLVVSGALSRGDRDLFRPLYDNLLNYDEYMLLADYASYVECQKRVSHVCASRDEWTRMSILNVARMGKFSSDRSIREYCADIWKVKSIPVTLHDLTP